MDGDADHAGTHSGRAEKEPIPDERKDDSKGDVFDDKETASNSKLGSSGSLEDAEFESAVKHFMAVNGNLKQVGVRAQSWVQSIKAQSSCGLAVGTASLDASRLEFEEEPTWIQAAEKLNDMAQLLDTKFATQLCSLLQRDILDPISVELETNKDTKSLVESGRSGRLTATQIDEAVSKLHEIMRRRKILLAQCITVLGSHQYNYYVRLAEQFQSIQPTVVDCKKRIADMTTASKTQAQRGSQEGSSSPIATSRPVPKAAEAAPNPSPAQPEPKPPVVEGDLLGMFGESPSGSQAAKVPAPVSVAKSSDTSGREADLLGGQPSKPAAKPANKGDLLGDLFSSPVQGVRSARQAPATGSPVPRAAADPLAEFLGTSAGPAKSAQPDFFGGGAQEMGPARVNGDDEVTKVVQRPRPRGPNDFKGTGTSREALKEQFEAHVENKAAAAAAEIRKLDEEKKKYEDLKFQMAVCSGFSLMLAEKSDCL